MVAEGKVLLVDLNNYARYPSLGIGYLVAPLRSAGYEVELLSPMAHGQSGVMREHQENILDHLMRRIYMAPPGWLWQHQDWLYEIYRVWKQRLTFQRRNLLQAEIECSKADVILLSAYLSHRKPVEFIAGIAARRGVPVLLGGPAFTLPGAAEDWARIAGVSAVFSGEAEFVIVDLVRALIRGVSLYNYTGVFVHSERASQIGCGSMLEPLAELNELPMPDLSDFPWELYPHRIVPLMASRGCGWGRCTFCSDVITANGRTFRSRSLEHVLDEIETQSRQYQARDFIFLDIKLNSDVNLWRGIIDNIQKRVPGAKWIGTVHVNSMGDNGLDQDTLVRAHESGLVRISFGMESGSQKMLRRMAKGCKVELNEAFIRAASRAGISVRSTMMVGYPGESTGDVDLTTQFLERNAEYLDRVNLCRFKPIPGTAFQSLYDHRPERFEDIEVFKWDYRFARASYRPSQMRDRRYRLAVLKMLNVVHIINRKPLRDNMIQFDGLM